MFARRAPDRFNRRRVALPFDATASLPLSFWTAGGYWDLTALSGLQNANISGTIPSLVGVNALTPSAVVNPKLQLNGVMGQNAARLVEDTVTNANYQYLSCDALAPLIRAASGWTVYMHVRPFKLSDCPYWSCLRSDGASNERLVGRFSSEAPCLAKYWAGPGNATYAGTRLLDPYGSQQIAWVFDGTNVTIYAQSEGLSDFVTMALGAINLTALSGGVNKFTFGASVSSVPYEAFSGYVARCAASSGIASAAQVQALFNQNAGSFYAKPRSSSPTVIYPGDSITLCAQDNLIGAGHREMLATWCYDNALSWYTYANGQGGGTGAGGAGIYRQGLSGNTFTSANSGQTISDIQTQALKDISGAASPVRFYPCVMGDGDNNALVPPATIAASYKAAAIALLNAGIARDPLFRMSVTTLPPLNRATLSAVDDNAKAFNALLKAGAGIWDQLDALYPGNKLFRWDSYAALDNLWSAADYGADAAHPQRSTGHAKMAFRWGNGHLWASDGAQNLATWLRAQSPSAAKPAAQTGAITSPSPAASLPNATPVTVTATCVRSGARAVLKRSGTVIADMVPVDSFTHFLASGAYAHTPLMQYSYTWTPGVGSVGAQTLTVDFTDFDGTTFSTAGVAVTVT